MMHLPRLRAALGGLLLLTLAAGAHALPPEIEADRLAIQAKAALDAENYAAADAALMRLQALGVALPDQFYYLRGVAANGIGKYKRALTNLEEYLKRTGKGGKYYAPALKTYSQAEEAYNRATAAATQARAEWDARQQEIAAEKESCRADAPRGSIVFARCGDTEREQMRELGERPSLPDLE